MKNLILLTILFFGHGSLSAQDQPNLPIPQSTTDSDKKERYIGHLLFSGVGLGLTGFGINERQKADDIYQTQYLSQTNANDARKFIQSADDKHRKGTQLIYAGSAILLVDFGLFFFKKRKKKKATNKMEKLSFRSFYNPDTQLQVGIQYIFGSK